MIWNKNIATRRIQDSIDSLPKIDTTQFEDYLKILPELQLKSGVKIVSPLDFLGHNRAIIVDGVHVYVNLINYDEKILQDGRETEKAHAEMLEFLHLHYRACDKVIENREAQRVDFHGPRMHAVVLEPSGKGNMKDRVIEAMKLAKEMEELFSLASKEINKGHVAKFRIGIDVGPCVAIDSGTSSEPEPLFLGNPANYAAKLAEGEESGIFMSNNARNILGVASVHDEKKSEITSVIESFQGEVVAERRVKKDLSLLVSELKEDFNRTSSDVDFKFKYYCPPLNTLKFKDLSRSDSVRIPLVSIYADIDGYTKYVDGAISSGQVEEAVKTLYVIREEFKKVLRDDCHGRKVRFIGDCIHGIIAVGTKEGINEEETINAGVECVAALRSSFNLCKELMPHASDLGLAIGLEFGETPISRIGIRGDRSVRVATSVATIASEKLQSRCNGNETAIGEVAYEIAESSIKDIFGSSRAAHDFDYNMAATIIGLESHNDFGSLTSRNITTPIRAHAR